MEKQLLQVDTHHQNRMWQVQGIRDVFMVQSQFLEAGVHLG